MEAVKVKNVKNEDVGEAKLASFWGEEPHQSLVHQAVVAALAGQRAGTHATKTRKDVSGGGRKPFKQKGTGRARQGTIRAPQMRGGGTVFGPHPRDYSVAMNKKMRKKALMSALAHKMAADSLIVIDKLAPASHRTSELVEVMDRLGVDSALVVADEISENLERASGNLGWLKVVSPASVNVYDVLAYGKLVVTRGALSSLEGALLR
jgi:large subunit ribosomal protein L4